MLMSNNYSGTFLEPLSYKNMFKRKRVDSYTLERIESFKNSERIMSKENGGRLLAANEDY